jgi:hypothetical protein
MRTLVGASVLILVGAISGAAALLSRETASAGAAFQAAASRPLVTMAEYERWQKELSNWGRWGPNDVNGTLNLITPAKRKQVAALVKEGFSVSLASDVPTQKSPVSPCPAEWAMVSGSTDRIAFPCIHGPGLTHLDALLGHVSFNGKTFNGYPVEEVVTKERGVAKGSIHHSKNGIVTRAVLYDIPRLKGVPYLEPGTRVFPEDLEAWEKKTGARVGAGDALLFAGGVGCAKPRLASGQSPLSRPGSIIRSFPG